MTHSTESLNALVALTRTLRGEWDVPGIRSAIRQALGRDEQPTMAELTYALVRIAENPTIATPGVLHMDGPHWRPLKPDSEPQRAIRCEQCRDLHYPWTPCHVPVASEDERQVVAEVDEQRRQMREEPELSRQEVKMHNWATRARAEVAAADKKLLGEREPHADLGAEQRRAERERRHARARAVIDERRGEEAS